MSQENVELVLRTHAAFSRADLEGFLGGYHPEAEYRAAVTQAVEGDAGDFKGHEGLRRWWRDLHELYEDLRTEVVEVLDLGERVVVVFVVSGRGRGSGIEDGQVLAQVVTFRHGKIVVIRDYLSRAEALEAVGRREYREALRFYADEGVRVCSHPWCLPSRRSRGRAAMSLSGAIGACSERP